MGRWNEDIVQFSEVKVDENGVPRPVPESGRGDGIIRSSSFG